MFAPFNIDVTVLEKDKVLANWDWEIRNWVRRDFARREIKAFEGVEVKEIRGDGKVEAVIAEVDGKTIEFPCDAVMISVGLTPNSEVAAHLGVEIGPGNEIAIDNHCRTSVPGVYAVGDVAGPPYFMAVARKRGMIAAKNIMGENAEWDDTLPLPDHIYPVDKPHSAKTHFRIGVAVLQQGARAGLLLSLSKAGEDADLL